MRIKNLLPLIFVLISFVGTNFYFLPEIAKSDSIKTNIFIIYYALIIFCSIFYWIGVKLTVPPEKKISVSNEQFVYLPIYLFVSGAFIFSYILFRMFYNDFRTIEIIFFSTLTIYSLAYCLGMIFIKRFLDGKELFLNRKLYNFGTLYTVPISYLAAIVIPFTKDNYLISKVLTYVSIAVALPFVIYGINMASSDNKSRTRIYKYILVLFYLLLCVPMVLLVPVIVENNLGSFIDQMICFLSLPYAMTLVCVLGIILTRIIYPPE